MNVRFSTGIGVSVVPDGERMPVGTISGILIHPEIGSVEGFFVRRQGAFFTGQTMFLSTHGIRRWGTRVHIADEDALCPIGDVLRCQSILESGKVILGQPMVTEDGRSLGRCRDVQFSTPLFQVEWLFPRKWWRWQQPIAFRDIKEVRPDVIVVRSAAIPLAVPRIELGGMPA